MGDHVYPPATVLVVDALANNGAVHITVDLAHRWREHGATLVVVNHPGDHPGLAVPDGTDVVYLASAPGRLRHHLLEGVRRLVRTVRRGEAVLNGSEIGIGLLLSYLAARIAGKPLIIAVHADLDEALDEWIPGPFQQRLTRFVHRHADAAICIADGVVDAIVRNGLPRERITVIRNGIDVEAVRERAAADVSIVEPGLPTVIATGRLARQKGYDLLLPAHAQLVSRVPHRLLILNDGPDREDLGRQAEQLGITGSVSFAGLMDNPLPSVAQASVFCLPSRHEGLPLALLEALALGVPCIASDSSPGVREALDDGRVGDLIPVEDVPALVAALEDALTRPERLRAKAALGPEHARAFGVETMAQGWAEALSRAAHRPGGRAR
ncbi:MAG TPA: glycosyltransferase [Arachnia sp.]|nr:glycosyltransferase [Arachnia sp.]HMT85204.1 glycosyltransferase [Arachnia sp.]